MGWVATALTGISIRRTAQSLAGNPISVKLVAFLTSPMANAEKHMSDITNTSGQDMVLGAVTGKKYYGCVISISASKLEDMRESRNVSKEEWIEVIVNFLDESRSIRMDYREFKNRLLNS